MLQYRTLYVVCYFSLRGVYATCFVYAQTLGGHTRYSFTSRKVTERLRLSVGGRCNSYFIPT